ncbi:MAG: HNH endonuclease [Candidatus Saganbacteria bacterium]|nr:HNH endonuclease [Candidatus Saganbacteria bacterium]
MAFSDETIGKAWLRAGGRCERCGRELVLKNRGREGLGAWEAHHKDDNENNDPLINCQILCWPCHSATF